MAVIYTFSFVWLILNTLSTDANATDALIAAPVTITLGEDILDITCSVSSPSYLEKVYSIQLLRNNSNTSPTLTVIADVESDSPTIKNDSDLQNRATLTGTVATPSTAQLKLSILASSTKCTDAVSYQCRVVAVVKSTGGTETYRKGRNVEVEVKPTSTDDISVSPVSMTDDGKYSFKPGTLVTLTCTGNVGNPAKLHRWCKKGVNDQVFVGYPNNTHINQEVSLQYRSTTCDYRRTSRLTYNITTHDTKIEFLCEDSTNNLCESGLFTKQVKIENGIAEVTTMGSTGIAEVTTMGSTGIAEVTTMGSTAIAEVTTVGSTGIAEVTTMGSTGIAEVTTMGSTAIAEVTTVGSTAIAEVTTVGSTDMAEVTTMGSTGPEHPNTISIVLISISTVLFVICAIYAAWNFINKRRFKGDKEKSQALATVSGMNYESRLRYANAGEASFDYMQDDIDRTGTEMIDQRNKSNDYQSFGNQDKPNVYQSLAKQGMGNRQPQNMLY